MPAKNSSTLGLTEGSETTFGMDATLPTLGRRPGSRPASLRDEYPATFAALASGWCWPDGELVPAPFGSSCIDCGVRVEFRHLWCPPCDDKRITRIETGFRDVAAAFEEAKA